MANYKFRLHYFYRQGGQRLGEEGRVCHTWQRDLGLASTTPLPTFPASSLLRALSQEPATDTGPDPALSPHNPELVERAEGVALGTELSLMGLSCPGESVLGPRCLSPGGPPSLGVVPLVVVVTVT